METKKSTTKAARGRGTKATKKPAAKATTAAKKTRATKKDSPAEKTSQMAAAERVLTEAGEPMNCKAMVEAMTTKGYWSSPGGKTPHSTLYAALLRHIRKHGKDARYVKTDRGMFALAGREAK